MSASSGSLTLVQTTGQFRVEAHECLATALYQRCGPVHKFRRWNTASITQIVPSLHPGLPGTWPHSVYRIGMVVSCLR